MGLLSSISGFMDKKNEAEKLQKGLLDIAGTKNPADVDMNKAAAMGRQLTGLQQQIGDGGLGGFLQHAGREFGANILNKTGLSQLGVGMGGDPLMQKHDMGDQGALPAVPTPMQAAMMDTSKYGDISPGTYGSGYTKPGGEKGFYNPQQMAQSVTINPLAKMNMEEGTKPMEFSKMPEGPSMYYDQIKKSSGDNKDKLMKLFKAFAAG
jgi:hypothetical protein